MDKLNPHIGRKLRAFRQRWRNLLLLRGVCGGLIAFLGALLLVALADYFIVMPDALRWVFSGAVYLGTLAVLWVICLRPLWHTPDSRELARMVEERRPDLREHLLAAVELGDIEAGAEWDSAVFRKILQEDVTERLQDVSTERLLPGRLIRAWLLGALALLLTLGLFALWPDGRQLLVRAVAPMANVERVSRVKIFLVTPALGDASAPQGDSVPVMVRLAGPNPDRVTLEIFPANGKVESVPMTTMTNRQYASTVAVGAESVQYRVRAGDGLTRKFTVLARPRPAVTAFDKTFQYPAYTKLPLRHTLDPEGHLAALEGTLIDLKLRVTQPVKVAELRLIQSGKTNIITLSTNSLELEGRFALRVSGTYTVHLVAAETGFDNKFSPQYELRALADLVPRVVLESPKADTIVPPEEVLAVKGAAQDDIGLARLVQFVQVNGSNWVETPLPPVSGTNAAIAFHWDLLKLNVVPGDNVTLKLAAYDLKGSKAESNPVKITIASPAFDPRRLAGVESRRQLHKAIIAVREGAEAARKALPADAPQSVLTAAELQRKQLAAAAISAADDLGLRFDSAMHQLKTHLKQARPGRESADLALLARTLAHIDHAALAIAQAELASLFSATRSVLAAQHAQEASQRLDQIAALAPKLEAFSGDLLGIDEADLAGEHLGYLMGEQLRVNARAEAAAATDPSAWERLARRQAGAAKEVQLVEEVLKQLATRLAGNAAAAETIGKLPEQLKAARVDLEKILAAKPGETLLAPAQAMQRALQTVATDLRPIGRDFVRRSDVAREELSVAAGSSSEHIEQLRRALESLGEAQGKIADATDPALLAARTRAGHAWQVAITQLQNRAGVEEQRRDMDPFFVTDLGKAALALGAWRTTAEAQPLPAVIEAVGKIARALRTLEAGHALTELELASKNLSHQERWEVAAADAASARPKDWRWLIERLHLAPRGFKDAELPDKAGGLVGDSAKGADAQSVSREMTGRADAPRVVPPVPPVPLAEPKEKR
ncbi:MAG: hypothetical protein EXS29_01625 [Pedosphaera sp.]|nr:hypothetical protein [Pedosphaera sp.]